MKEPSFAVVVCTRNRPGDLEKTLRSVCLQSGIRGAFILVVDASDPHEQAAVTRIVQSLQRRAAVRLLTFDGPPSLARQRNLALDHLPSSARCVHFLDDDVTLEAGYLARLNALLAENPQFAGAGGRVIDSGQQKSRSRIARTMLKFFLLDAARPGAVLLSGTTTPVRHGTHAGPITVDWLSGCAASYPRNTFERMLFDDRLVGYSLDEDLDFSYRAGRLGRLVVDPSAVLYHTRSAEGRLDAETGAFLSVVHRYWFMQKNCERPMWRIAWAWSMIGRLVIPLLSGHPDRWRVLRGRIKGMAAVVRRRHYLLNKERE
jgi:GT2 family glycosyltransferase